MQADEAQKRRVAWGDKPCDHPSLVKEYINGSATGDYVCKRCGEADWGSDWPERERKQK